MYSCRILLIKNKLHTEDCKKFPKQFDIERHPEKTSRVNRKYNRSVAEVDAFMNKNAVTQRIQIKNTYEVHLELKKPTIFNNKRNFLHVSRTVFTRQNLTIFLTNPSKKKHAVISHTRED